MSTEQESRRRIVAYLQSGAKESGPERVGVELEHFILDGEGKRVPYEESGGQGGCATQPGVEDILEQLAEHYPQVTRTHEGRIMGCARPSASITIEPSAQIELSIAPLANIADIRAEYEDFRALLDALAGSLGYSVCICGYSPWGRAADLPLIPKARYHFMDAHFKKIDDMHAERMMRASASLQVSLDFADEADAVRKMRLATLLGPVFSLLMDNVPVFGGEPNDQHLRRLQIWREVDPARCQVVPGLFDEGFCFGAYADWLLDIPPIFTTRGEERATGFAPAREVYADAPLEEADIEHLLGMCWPDVRLKRYVEIRQADAAPLDLALAYVALIKGLFYGPGNMDALEQALGVNAVTPSWSYTEEDVEQAIAAIIQDGFSAHVYGRGAWEWAEMLLQLAAGALGDEESYLEPLRKKMEADRAAEIAR